MAKGWLASVKQGAALLTWRRMTGMLNKVSAVRFAHPPLQHNLHLFSGDLLVRLAAAAASFREGL